jgi:L-lactate dehydrogenase complex protein LldG
MTGARGDILAAIAAAGPARMSPDAIAEGADELLCDLLAIQPRLPSADPVEAFAMRVVSPHIGATLDRIGDLSALPAAVAHYLSEHGLPLTIGLQPDPSLNALPWAGFFAHTPVNADQTAAVGVARYGIAETGSLVFHSGSDTAVLGHFFPLHHIAVVHAVTIVAHLEAYAMRAGPAPRNVNLITGASGTTDIEGRLVRGAHGPRYLHVIIVEKSVP